jgi:hypothetical protein
MKAFLLDYDFEEFQEKLKLKILNMACNPNIVA